jgi:hypothetical protein
LSEDGRRAWRTAAILLVVNVILGAAVAFVTKSGGGGFAWIIGMVLAYQLYHLRAGAGTAVIVVACLSGVLGPFLLFRRGPALDAAILSLAAWGLVAALLMLLIGEAKRSRRILAVVTFCFLTGGVVVLVILGSLMENR